MAKIVQTLTRASSEYEEDVDQSLIRDIDAVIEVLRSDRLTTGPFVEEFESKLAKHFGAGYVSAVSSGTAALHLAALALDWGSGDIVLTTPITFLATANAAKMCNAPVFFADTDSITGLITPSSLEQAIQNRKFIEGRQDIAKRALISAEEKLKDLSAFDTEDRNRLREIYSQADECELKSGKLLVQSQLRKIAGISKEVVLVGMSRTFEIWSKDRWEKNHAFGLSNWFSHCNWIMVFSMEIMK